MQNVVITGATGYLGSHLALRFLEEDEDTRLILLARAHNDRDAEARVLAALQTACLVEGSADDGDRLSAWKAQGRLHILDAGDLATFPQRGSAAIADRLRSLQGTPARGEAAIVPPPEFWHCAAAVAFTETQEGAVRRNNLAALEATLALAHETGCGVFNHVSTAYVAGTRQGELGEQIGPKPERFHNVYEESKYACEERVAAFHAETDIAYRIHRPSIIIGHSVTKRTSSRVGFYYCLDIVRQFYNKVTFGESGFFRNRTFHLLLDPDATLNLIPIDVVVAEMRAIRAAGNETMNRVFHETNPNPLAIEDAITAIGTVIGVPHVEVVKTEAALGFVDKVFSKKMKLLNPYLSRHSHFDRTNVLAAHADRHTPDGTIDVETLKSYVVAYLQEFK